MMAVVVAFLAFNVWLAACVAYEQWWLVRKKEPPPRRLRRAALLALGIRQLFLAGMLAYTFAHGDWTPASVGIHASRPWMESILVGELSFLALALLYLLLARVGGVVPAMRLAVARGNLRIWPRGKADKVLAGIFIMGFNPFTEELVMRGILIHHWGLLLGSAVVPIVVGFVLNAIFHWYQGWRLQLWHALYFAMAVALLYSPWGMIAVLTAHVLGDFVPVVTLRRQVLRVRNQQRKARAARAAQPA